MIEITDHFETKEILGTENINCTIQLTKNMVRKLLKCETVVIEGVEYLIPVDYLKKVLKSNLNHLISFSFTLRRS